MALMIADVIWLQWLLEDFDVSVSMPTPLYLTVQGLSVLLVIW
jgi:hypothetical protein